jgi:hypothetical protein
MADEFLGRGAGIARAAVGPLGAVGRVVVAAGVVLWVMGPAPIWESRPSLVASLILLVLLVAPGMRLVRHRSRMRQVLDDLPTLTDKLETALQSPAARVGVLADHWGENNRAGKEGPVHSGLRAWRFYRDDIRPLREGPGEVIAQLTDALAAFTGSAVMVSGVALVIGVVLVVLAPISVLFRLFNLG